MPTTDWIWSIPCLLAAVALFTWVWRAAGDDRALAVTLDHRLLQAIARHHSGPAVLSRSPLPWAMRDGLATASQGATPW